MPLTANEPAGTKIEKERLILIRIEILHKEMENLGHSLSLLQEHLNPILMYPPEAQNKEKSLSASESDVLRSLLNLQEKIVYCREQADFIRDCSQL